MSDTRINSVLMILDRPYEEWAAMSMEGIVDYFKSDPNGEEKLAILSEVLADLREVKIDDFQDDLRLIVRNRKTSDERRATAQELLDGLRDLELDMINLDGKVQMAAIDVTTYRDEWDKAHHIDGTKEGPVTVENLELGDPVTSDRDDITYTVTLPASADSAINIAGYEGSQKPEPKEVILNVEPATLELASVNDAELEFRVVGEDGKIAYIRIVNWKNGTFFVNQASDLMRDWPPDVLKHIRLSNGDEKNLFEIFYGEGSLGELAWMEEQIHEEADDREGASPEESSSRPKRREDLPLLERAENRPLEPHVWRGRKID